MKITYPTEKKKQAEQREIWDIRLPIKPCHLCGNGYPLFGYESFDEVRLHCGKCNLSITANIFRFGAYYGYNREITPGYRTPHYRDAILFLIYRWNHGGKCPKKIKREELTKFLETIE